MKKKYNFFVNLGFFQIVQWSLPLGLLYINIVARYKCESCPLPTITESAHPVKCSHQIHKQLILCEPKNLIHQIFSSFL